MEWLVPILFVLVSLFQWWAKRRAANSPTSAPEAYPPNPPPSGDPLDEFGDLLEALGRRRHESPPPLPQLEKAPPPRILPPIETAFALAPQVPSPRPLPRLRAQAPFSTAENWDVATSPRRWMKRSHPWPEAIVLTEILAPPVALR